MKVGEKIHYNKMSQVNRFLRRALDVIAQSALGKAGDSVLSIPMQTKKISIPVERLFIYARAKKHWCKSNNFPSMKTYPNQSKNNRSYASERKMYFNNNNPPPTRGGLSFKYQNV